MLQEIIRNGIKKIQNVKISEMECKGDLDYDEIMNFSQILLKKDMEQFENEKKKKIKDLEYWTRAIREEEKIAILKYAIEHDDEEISQINIRVRERHEKEIKLKQSLKKAHPIFLLFKAAVMQQRKDKHEALMQNFIAKNGN